MSESESAPVDNAVFLPAHERTDAHIVDVLIEERCPSFVAHWSWPVIRPVLYSMLGYKKALAMADMVATQSGARAFDDLSAQLEFDMTFRNGLDRIPETGPLLVAINHPTGLADGIAVWSALTRKRRDIEIFANADAIRVSQTMTDVIIPVEWVVNKRSTAKTKETLRRAKQAFENGKCVVIFPSGKLAGREDGKMIERPWFPTVVSLARKQKCPVLPLHLSSKNSELYYFLSKLNGELRDITLFYELLNKKGSKFELTFGKPIPPDDLVGDAQEVTDLLKAYVAYELGDAPDLTFAEWREQQTSTEQP